MNALHDSFRPDCAPGDVALAYARLRLRVLPLHTPILRRDGATECSCWMRDTCPHIGKHPRWRKGMIEHGALDASASEATVGVWWKEWPWANVGIATGDLSRLLLLDGDPRNGCVESLQRLERTYGRLPDTWEVRTGGGGWHRYFRLPVDGPAIGCAGLGDDYPGLDVKGNGGYATAPPPLHQSGRRYTWAAAAGVMTPTSEPLDAPAFLLDLLARSAAPIVRPATLQTEELSADDEGRDWLDWALTRTGDGVGDRVGYELAQQLLIAHVADVHAPLLDYAERATVNPRSPFTERDVTRWIKSAEKSDLVRQGAPAKARHQAHAAPVRPIPLRGDEDGNPEDDEDQDREEDDDGETGYVDADPASPAEGGNFAGPSPEVRPFVQLNDVPLRTKIDQTMAALLAANTPTPSVFVRGGALARFRWNEQGQPVIDPLGEAALRGYMTRVAEFVTTTKTGYSHKDPPVELSRVLVAAGSWPGLPPLVGIVEAPTLRPDGTLLDSPGYDLVTGLIYAPAAGLVVPEIPAEPTAADSAESVHFIERELLHDFPFCAPADKAHAWAVLLTPIVRAAIAGCVPLLLLDAPKAGTGKTLLAGVSAVIATGRKAEVMTAPAHDEAEWRKKLTTILREHATIVLIDNLPDVLKSAQLAAVLTAQTWRDRVLGVSQSVTLPQRATWLATGNNIRLGGDLPRRCVRLRIDAKEARPWQRQPDAFVHADLLGWVKAHRGKVLAALLTVARAWFVAGCPEAPSKTPRALGGFEDWQRVLGGILAYAGIEGFLDNLDELYEQADDDTPQWEAFLLAWRTTFADRAVSVAEVAGRLDVDQKEEIAERRVLLPALPERLADAYGRRRESFGHHLGRALAGQEDTRYGDEHLYVARDRTAKDRKGGVRWQLHVGKPKPPETPA